MNDPAKDEDVFGELDGEEYCVEEHALEILLREEVLLHGRYCRGRDCDDDATALYVDCSDTFAWACADAEPLPPREIPVLYRMWRADNRHGGTRWCCIRRNMKPMYPVAQAMRKAGHWDEVMEALPNNSYDDYVNSRGGWGASYD